MSLVTRVDRISIRVPGVDRDFGLLLGRLVAERLVPSLQPGPGEASLDLLRVQVSALPGEAAGPLAARIVAQVADALEAGR